MEYIVLVEGRTFSYRDFRGFEVNDCYYTVRHGTCRNKFSKFVKMGLIELEFNSQVSFYTLRGHGFGKSSMTRNHMGISSVTNVTGVTGIEIEKLFEYLQTVPLEEAAVHDIHFKFTVLDIYKMMSSSAKYSRQIKPVSYDIILSPEIIDGLKITPIVHRTDTVTLGVACSATPVPISEEGITRLSCALTRVEERLSFKLDECRDNLAEGFERNSIPDNLRWMVTMWHFGRPFMKNNPIVIL